MITVEVSTACEDCLVVLQDMLMIYKPAHAVVYYFTFSIEREELLHFYRLFFPRKYSQLFEISHDYSHELDPEYFPQRSTVASQFLWSHVMWKHLAMAWHSTLCSVWDKEALLTALGWIPCQLRELCNSGILLLSHCSIFSLKCPPRLHY